MLFPQGSNRAVKRAARGWRRGAEAVAGVAVALVLTAAAQAAAGPRGSSGAPGAPTQADAAVTQELAPQLVPPDSPLTIALSLETRGYDLPLRPPGQCELVLDWYAKVLVGSPRRPSTVLVAHAQGSFGDARPSSLMLVSTGAGRRLLRRTRSLEVDAAVSYQDPSGVVASVYRDFELR